MGAALMTLSLVGVITLQASICNSGKKQGQKDEVASGPRLSRYRGEAPEQVVLANAGESLQESK
ncbi:hypothetical protein ANCCAN_05625 [Ancylostoma caninum]|uniref:Uncharacterized protein n=1 Tax=Ancylostoma caninum TaxID=29170 RepID=A0A368GVD3_ANCCA|nr:hypothetical protein ANCCAN_05625 [Ancylostoma caninum]